MKTYKENILPNYGKQSTALGGESGDSIESAYYFDSANYDLIAIRCAYTGIASGSTLTLVGYQATSTAGAGSKTISGATASKLSAGTSGTGVLIVQVRPWDLDIANGYRYVGGKVSTDNASGAEIVSMTIDQLNARYPQATLPADR